MLKSILILSGLFFFINANSQSFHIVRLDSARWRIEQRTPTSSKGGGQVILSDIADSATTITRFTALVEHAKRELDENVALKKYDALNTELKRASGKQYEDLLREVICESLVGQWELIKGSDTLSLSVNKDLKVSGGPIRGELKYNNPQDIQLIGIYKEPEKLAIIQKGQLTGKGIKMTMN